MATHTITQSDLDQFIGTENWYRHGIARNVTFTDGVKFLAEKAGAFWLIDEIVFAQRNKKLRGEEFQVWKLNRKVVDSPEPTVKEDGSWNLKPGAVLTCEDGNDHVLFTKRIGFTDFPLPEVRLYFEGNVILLPTEH